MANAIESHFFFDARHTARTTHTKQMAARVQLQGGATSARQICSHLRWKWPILWIEPIYASNGFRMHRIRMLILFVVNVSHTIHPISFTLLSYTHSQTLSTSFWREHQCTCTINVMKRTVNCVYFKRQFYFVFGLRSRKWNFTFSFASAVKQKPNEKKNNISAMNRSDGHTRNVTIFFSCSVKTEQFLWTKSLRFSLPWRFVVVARFFMCRQELLQNQNASICHIFVCQWVSVYRHWWNLKSKTALTHMNANYYYDY